MRDDLRWMAEEMSRAKDCAVESLLEHAVRLCGGLDGAKGRVERIVVAGRGLTVVTLDGVPCPMPFGVFAGMRGDRFVVKMVSLDEEWPEWRKAECFDTSRIAPKEEA